MKRLFSFLSLVAIVACSISVRAQLVPRTVLLEEGTNWSCPPCAVLNPILEAFLATKGDSIIQIAYHPNWPGANDPMYMNDVSDNQGRVVSYYGISGVPTVEVDGSVSPSQYSSFDSAFHARLAVLSPIAIAMSRTQSGSTVTVTVTVKAVGDISGYSNLKLRVAAVQRIVDTSGGTNGEKRFPNAMREMMPNLNGTALTLKVGTPQTFTFSYDIGDSYRPEKMYEVAFVQSDKNKEVLQAASTLESFNVSAKAPQAPVQVLSASSGSLDLQLSNTTPEDLTFNAVYLPTAGKDWTVTLNGQGKFSVPLKSGGASTISLGITPDTSAYTAGLVLVSTITGRQDTVIRAYPVKFIAPDTKIAFVDVSADSTKSVPTLKTLTAMKLRYVPLTDIEASSAKVWSASVFSTIVLEANKWIVTGTNKAAVANYLQSGGHLLIHGGEIAFGLADPLSTASDIDIPFLENTLHADYVKDVATTRTVHGVASDPISDAFAAQSINIFATNTDVTIQPDVITAKNGSVPIFYYGTGTATAELAGVRWDDGTTKLAYLAFGLQNLATTQRQQIIAAVLKWFSGAASAPSVTANSFELSANYPNPFSTTTAIPYSLTRDESVRIAIVDAGGNEIAIVANDVELAGQHLAKFDAKGLARGTYFCVIHTAEGSSMRAMTVE